MITSGICPDLVNSSYRQGKEDSMRECWLCIFCLSLQVFRIVLISGDENEEVSIIPLRINPLAIESLGHALPMMDGYDPRKPTRVLPFFSTRSSLLSRFSSESLRLILTIIPIVGISSLMTSFEILRRDMKQAFRS